MQTQLSTDADLDGLNATLDLSELDATIDEAMGDWDQSLTDFEDTLAPVDDGVTEAKSAITADQVDGIAAGIFLLCWIVLICVLVAILLRTLGAMSGSKLAHLDWYCWWTAFVIGVFYMVIIVLPVFGWLTAAALPFETVCAILPAQGENAGLASVGCGDGPRVDACCGCGGLLDTVHVDAGSGCDRDGC